MSNNNASLFEKIRSKTEDFADSTSLHDHLQVANSPCIWRRLVWAALILTSWAYGIYVLTTTVVAFLQYQVVTSYDRKFEIKRDFPAVTFFNHNKSRWC